MRVLHFLRGICRLVGFLLITVWFIARIVLGGMIRGADARRAMHLRKRLSQALTGFLNIRCTVKGEIPDPGVLIVSNHRSYIDSVAIFQFVEACPVVKAEVSRWPIIGYGLRNTATVFVDRKDPGSRARTRAAIGEVLAKGGTVVVFVEGTTYIGPLPGEFRPGTFQTAAEGGFTIVPVAIEYRVQEMAWVGSDSFIPHFIKVFGSYATTDCTVSYGPLMTGSDGLALRDAAYTWVSSELGLLRRRYDESL